MSDAIVRTTETAPVVAGDHPDKVLALLDHAIERGLDAEGIERLVGLMHRSADRLAAQEFADALARFQAECPPVPMARVATVASARGSKFSYTYANKTDIAAHVRPYLHPVGFSFSWDSATQDNLVTATCTLRHRNGHSETASFSVPIDSSAGMTLQQKHESALSYAERRSLTAVLGLTTTDQEIERGLRDAPDPISEDQVARLEEMLEAAEVDKVRVLRYVGLPDDATLADIPKARYRSITEHLDKKLMREFK